MVKKIKKIKKIKKVKTPVRIIRDLGDPYQKTDRICWIPTHWPYCLLCQIESKCICIKKNLSNEEPKRRKKKG